MFALFLLLNHMVESLPNLDPLFKALSDPARRTILATLTEGPATVGDLAEPLDMSLAGASKHVNILVEARLVEKRKVGRQQICRLNAKPMRELRDWLDQYSKFWTAHLDALEIAVRGYQDDKD